MSANSVRAGGARGNVTRVRRMDPRPRFTVAEVEGFPMTGHVPRQARPMLSCSVLDSAYCFEEVARFNEEDVRPLRLRQRERREALRNRAAGLAAMLNADHA